MNANIFALAFIQPEGFATQETRPLLQYYCYYYVKHEEKQQLNMQCENKTRKKN